MTLGLLLWFSNLCEMCCFFLSNFLTTVVVYMAQLNTLVDLDYAKYKESINNQIGNIELLKVQYATSLIGEPTETIGNSMNILFWYFLYQFRWLYRWAVFITFRGGYIAESAFVFPSNDLIHNVNRGILAIIIIDWQSLVLFWAKMFIIVVFSMLGCMSLMFCFVMAANTQSCKQLTNNLLFSRYSNM